MLRGLAKSHEISDDGGNRVLGLRGTETQFPHAANRKTRRANDHAGFAGKRSKSTLETPKAYGVRV